MLFFVKLLFAMLLFAMLVSFSFAARGDGQENLAFRAVCENGNLELAKWLRSTFALNTRTVECMWSPVVVICCGPLLVLHSWSSLVPRSP